MDLQKTNGRKPQTTLGRRVPPSAAHLPVPTAYKSARVHNVAAQLWNVNSTLKAVMPPRFSPRLLVITQRLRRMFSPGRTRIWADTLVSGTIRTLHVVGPDCLHAAGRAAWVGNIDEARNAAVLRVEEEPALRLGQAAF